MSKTKQTASSATKTERAAQAATNAAKGMVKVAVPTRNGGFRLRMMTGERYAEFLAAQGKAAA